jgi:hypothetical protein
MDPDPPVAMSPGKRRPRALALALATALVVLVVEVVALGLRLASTRPLGASALPLVLHVALLALSAAAVVAIARGSTRTAARIALALQAWLALAWTGLLVLQPVAAGYVVANALVTLGWIVPIGVMLLPHARAGAPRWASGEGAAPATWPMRIAALAGLLAFVALAVVITWRSLRG